MSLAGCQINPIYVNFQLQKCLEIFDKNSADKIGSKKDRGWKVPSLMPIRVKLSQQQKIVDFWLFGREENCKTFSTANLI